MASKRKTEAEAEKAVNDMLEKVKERVGEYIYSCDDEELVQVVCRKLMDRGLTLSSAESCTGGLFAAAVTDIPGILSGVPARAGDIQQSGQDGRAGRESGDSGKVRCCQRRDCA